MTAADGANPGLGDMLSQLTAIQEELVAAQAAVAGADVEGRSGGGAVKVVVTGDLSDVRSVTISADAVEAGDVSLLEDLVLAALRDAVGRARSLHRRALGGFSFGGGALPGAMPPPPP
ncbi:MAG: YbaB/EbfC family nucleoid-associated protein [Acidimicrobiales bacterium]